MARSRAIGFFCIKKSVPETFKSTAIFSAKNEKKKKKALLSVFMRAAKAKARLVGPKKAVTAVAGKYRAANFFGNFGGKNRAAKRLGKANSAVIGRPVLANRVARTLRDRERRDNIMVLGNLPFLDYGELSYALNAVKDGRRAAGEFNRYRIFSRREIDGLRKAAKNGEEGSAHMIKSAIEEKGRIMDLAAVEPRLTRIVFTEFLDQRNLNSRAREKGIGLISKLSAVPEGMGVIFDWKDLRKGREVTVFFSRINGIDWKFRKLVKGKHP